jgi:ubiquinone/menaquinone biosynthesis C-methylase UbiE
MNMDSANVWGITGCFAEIYHSHFVPALIGSWAPRVAALVQPLTGERILDMACGTGVLTRHVAKLVGPSGRVVGLDINPEMLIVARRATHESDDAAIEWREGSAGALPYPDASFDAVTCQLGLMFFPDRVAALKDMRRVLAKGGRIAVMTWGELDACPGNSVMDRVWVERFGAAQADNFKAAHSLSQPEAVQGLLRAAGFHQVDARKEQGRARFPSPHALACRYSALAGIDTDAATRDAICDSVARHLSAYCGKDGLDYPVEAILARAIAD